MALWTKHADWHPLWRLLAHAELQGEVGEHLAEELRSGARDTILRTLAPEGIVEVLQDDPAAAHAAFMTLLEARTQAYPRRLQAFSYAYQHLAAES